MAEEELIRQLSSKLLNDEEYRSINNLVFNKSPAGFGSPSNLSSSVESRHSVHDRLYELALERRTKREELQHQLRASHEGSISANRSCMSWVSAALTKDRVPKDFSNYGEMLYVEGLETLAIKREKALKVKIEKEAKEVEGATFNPAITKMAKELRGSAGEQGGPEKWQRLSGSGMHPSTLERLRQMKEAKQQEEMKECTFQPRVNASSISMVASHDSARAKLRVSDHLYQDALERLKKAHERSARLPDDVTLVPQINRDAFSAEYLRRSWEHLWPGREVSASDHTGTAKKGDVVRRLYAFHEKTKAKHQEMAEKQHEPVDPVTGKPLFVPDTGRAPRSGRNTRGKPVFDYLYELGEEKLEKQRQVQQEEIEHQHEEAGKERITGRSKELFKGLKAKRFQQVFEHLTSNELDLLDLHQLVCNPTPELLSLDAEVREDVELAAHIHSQKQKQMPHAAAADALVAPLSPEGSSVASNEVTPRPHTRKINGSPAAGPLFTQAEVHGSLQYTPPSEKSILHIPPPPVSLSEFENLMEAALLLRRGPRVYLTPSPIYKIPEESKFRPSINKRSKSMAAKLRPPEVDLCNLLYQTAKFKDLKLEEARRAKEESSLRECTFAPKLNASSRNVESRVAAVALVPNKTSSPSIMDSVNGLPYSNIQVQKPTRDGSWQSIMPQQNGLKVPSRNSNASLERGGQGHFGSVLHEEHNDLDTIGQQELSSYSERYILELLANPESGEAKDDQVLHELLQELMLGDCAATICKESPSPARTASKTVTTGGLQDLAASIAEWDYDADPTMSSVY